MISIIDDDEAVRETTKVLVRSIGFDADTFASAEEFLRSSRVNDTACVIADIKMPGMSGMELQSVLLAHGNRTPVIFMTAFPEERIRQRVLNAGAVGFLGKPFDDECLINCLEAALKTQRGANSQQ